MGLTSIFFKSVLMDDHAVLALNETVSGSARAGAFEDDERPTEYEIRFDATLRFGADNKSFWETQLFFDAKLYPTPEARDAIEALFPKYLGMLIGSSGRSICVTPNLRAEISRCSFGQEVVFEINSR